MLAELKVHVETIRATPMPFRPHVGAAVRHWSLGTRQYRAWAPHLAQARGLIDTTIDDIARRRVVVVLGAGPLFDIPLESLGRTFEQVVLVDRVHPSATNARVARYRNVRRIWRDLSPETDAAALDFLGEIDGLDWVISSTLVAQLAAGAAAPARRQVVDRHLDALAGLPCPVTLIADLDYRVLNRHGVLRDSADLLHGRPMPRSGLRWKWEVCPFGEEGRDTRRVHYVAGWPDWREAAG